MVTRVDQSQREFSWDATTRQIKTDGDWAYNLTPGDDISYNRTNHLGQTEIWFDDASKASIYERDLSGNETITSYFGAGPLYKKVRKIVTIRNGVTTTAYQASYDEQGRLIREETTNSQGRKKQIDFLNDQVNKTQYVVENGQLISVRKWKVNGKMDKIIDFNLRSVIDFVDSGECQRLPLSKDEMNQTIETYNNRSKNL
jgi:YD repeat-containing protein